VPLLKLESITKDFPGVRALDRVSLELEKEEVHALVGENGAGKSTLIKILSGFYPHGSYGGEIVLRDAPARFPDVRAAERQGIAVIAQELALVPEMTVAENLMLGREPTSRGLIRWDRLRSAARAALARVLDLVRDLRIRGVSSIYVSHRLEEVFAIADRITVLRDGRSVATAPVRDWTPGRVIAAMVGRELEALSARPSFSPGDIALSVEGWQVEDPVNPGRLVLDGVSLTVREGEIVGVAGLMGSGRSALVSSLFGLARGRVGGRLRIRGRAEEAPFRHPAEAIRAGLALVSEDRKRSGLVPEASVLENMTLPTLDRFRRRGFLDDSARARSTREQIEALAIKTPSAAARVAQLSGGTQQKIVLGKWLLVRPRVLLLDEPTRGIDVATKAEIHRLVGRLAMEGVAILLVSSELPELLSLSHRVVVLCQGRPTASFSATDATPQAVMAAATGTV
jgi:D-xylose transport system ATP-binding protein